jgi:hypothetical protein
MMHWEVMKQLRERGVKRYDFGGAWLRDAGLESSLADHPRRVLVIYANPKHVEVLDASRSLRRVRAQEEAGARSRRKEAHSYAIYESVGLVA